MSLIVGVLALQGGFHEHISLLRSASLQLSDKQTTFDFIEVKTPQELARCDGLIIPGGESTTIALIASRSGLLEPLRDFVKFARKPTWGTCAGLILLSEQANAAKKGGQELIGGLDVRVHRNHFGRQIESFVADLDLPFLAQSKSLEARGESSAVSPFSAVFIRAPVVEALLREGEEEDGRGKVEVLATLPSRTKQVEGSSTAETDEIVRSDANDIIAVRQDNVFGTSFHPELTEDTRIHVWWLEQILSSRNLPVR